MKPSKIESLHRSLKSEFGRALEFAKLGIAQPQKVGDWHKARVGLPVVFELLYDGVCQEQVAQRDMGARCSVFALHPTKDAPQAQSSRYWVSWFEKWRVKVARQELNLCTAGWSVFAGPRNQEKQQIIRAEWDQLSITGSKKSGQPHWHVDRFLRLEAPICEATTADASLAIANAADSTSELADLHLAMGAWNQKEEHPRCWQRSAEKSEDVLTWGVNTLLYLKSELSGQR